VVANSASVFSTIFQEAYRFHYALLLSLSILIISLGNQRESPFSPAFGILPAK